MHFKRFFRLTLVLIPIVAACNEDNEFGLGVGPDKRFSASLSGANVRPIPVATGATAAANISIRDPEIGQGSRSVAFVVTSSLTSVSAVHIHLGGPAVANGQQLATLYTNSTDTTLTSTQLAAGAISENGLAVSIDSLTTLMQLGAAYIDIHSTAFPAGVLRGQLGKSGADAVTEKFAASLLNGAKERPAAVTTTATGSATFVISAPGTIQFTLSVAGITGATMAHIHTAVADSAGPIVVPLFNAVTPTGQLTGTLASGTLTASSITLPGVSMDSLVSLMRRGRTYVNVHTVLNPLGEIRAQIDPTTTLP